MDLSSIERRREPRTSANLPIEFQIEGLDDSARGQLVDLSHGGAGLMTTDGNAPGIGERVAIEFRYPVNNEDTSEMRFETGLVCSVRHPARGLARIGVRFLQSNGEGSFLSGPKDRLDDRQDQDKKPSDIDLFAPLSRWNGIKTTKPLATVN